MNMNMNMDMNMNMNMNMDMNTNMDMKEVEPVQSEAKDEQIDIKTKGFLDLIKNPIFIENIYDTEKKQIVNSIYLNKITKIGRQMSTMVWQYYRHRGKLNVNKVIKQYGRENLTINYKIFQ